VLGRLAPDLPPPARPSALDHRRWPPRPPPAVLPAGDRALAETAADAEGRLLHPRDHRHALRFVQQVAGNAFRHVGDVFEHLPARGQALRLPHLGGGAGRAEKQRPRHGARAAGHGTPPGPGFTRRIIASLLWAAPGSGGGSAPAGNRWSALSPLANQPASRERPWSSIT